MTTMPTSTFRITRLIAAAMAGGVAALWLIAWVLTGGGAEGLSPDALPSELALVVWAAVALPGFGAALFFRERAARSDSGRFASARRHAVRLQPERPQPERRHSERRHSERRHSERRHSERRHSERVHSERRVYGHDPGSSAEERQQVQTNVVIAHALLEGPALLGGVFLLLFGTSPVTWAALPVYALGLLIAWPRADWFGDGGTSDAGRRGAATTPRSDANS